MYGDNRLPDLKRFTRASLTNLLAIFPFYLRIGIRTGRGLANERPEDVAAYFRRCVDDYCTELGVDASFLRGKRVLEYGPGDTLGVALVLYAFGAEAVHTVDHFPLHQINERTVSFYRAILQSLDGDARARAERAFRVPGDPTSGFDPAAIEHRVTPRGLSHCREGYDLIISRSVLALVQRLDETLADIAAALKPGGVSIHKVDLSSHGLDRGRPFEFLSWPEPLYQLMYSRKGRPNRWRADRYEQLVSAAGLELRKLTPTGRISDADVENVRPHLDPMFRNVPDEVLPWTGFWMVLERPG